MYLKKLGGQDHILKRLGPQCFVHFIFYKELAKILDIEAVIPPSAKVVILKISTVFINVLLKSTRLLSTWKETLLLCLRILPLKS